MSEKDKLKKKIFKEGEKKTDEAKPSQVQKVQKQVEAPEPVKEEIPVAETRPEERKEEILKIPEHGVEVKLSQKQPIQPKAPKFFSIFPRGKIIKFMEKRKLGYIFSGLLFIFSLFVILSGRVPLGVDFKGGLSADVKFANPIRIDDVRSVLPEASVQSIGQNSFLIKLPLDVIEAERTEEGIKKDPAQVLSERIQGLGQFEIMKIETVGSIIGRELREKGVLAFALSLIGIFIYITFRFEWRFAIGAVLALIHDIIITLGIISVLGVELSIVTLAGLLTLAGYSVNDSVIVADRIREKLRFARGLWTSETINKAITDTLPRTIITGITTLFPSVALIIFGGEVLRDIGITFAVGLIIGTYSSIYICSAIAYDIYLSQRTKKQEDKQKVQSTTTSYVKAN